MNTKKPFYFVGRGPDSKSLLIRAWLVKSFFTDFEIKGRSLCDDVQAIEKAVSSLHSKKEIHCGDSAAALRFMALRTSRTKGSWILSGSRELFSRPHQPLLRLLSQLGVKAELQDQTLRIESQGWRLQGDALHLSMNVSSQFASAVMLSSFNLEKDLFISIEGRPLSLSYFKMTLSFLKNLGLKIEGSFPEFHIPKGQGLQKKSCLIEPDMSCLFALASFAALNGQAVFSPWPAKSLQPDYKFPEILKKMGVVIHKKEQALKVSSPEGGLHGGSFDLSSNPDLFCSLAVLCALAKGESRLFGAPHLSHKESPRIEQTLKLLKPTGREISVLDGGLEIKGPLNRPSQSPPQGPEKILFDTSDHRMAMAAALLAYGGFRVEVKAPHCVNKSFPDFWKIIEKMT